MTLKTLLAAAALAATSATASFASCAYHEQTAMSCAEGSVYDAETKACVPLVSS